MDVDLLWLEKPVWLVAVVTTALLTAKLISWFVDFRSDIGRSDGGLERFREREREPSPQPTNGESAEWRGETAEVLRGIRSVLKEHVDNDLRIPLEDHARTNREVLEVLREVRRELAEHNEEVETQHQLLVEVHKMLSKWL